ncbi:MAG: endonuclease/exonuclease/phosphatase family protein [Acidobacteria bacterium]|nr:endonuclease/exonuclease/phosphatase family protein [Acidobacteriota bacterium]
MPGPPPDIRVLVFNMHAGKDAAGTPNLEGVVDVVRSTDADIVLLQEVDRGTGRSGKEDQLQRLADLLNDGGKNTYSTAFGKSLDFDGGEYGIAALVRGAIDNTRTEALPVQPPQERSGGSQEPRAALMLTAETRLGAMNVLNTHLDSSTDEHYRLQESARVVELTRAMGGEQGVMAGGDFNAEPGSRTYQRLLFAGLRDAWRSCGSGDGFTYPADKPVKRIDYLFLAGGLRCKSAQVIDSRVSDHRPLLVTITR